MKSSFYFFWFLLIFVFGFFSFLLGIYMTYTDIFYFVDWEILTLNSCSLVMTMLFDKVSLLFIGSVLFISSMVIFYSSSYMSGDKNNYLFLILVLFFIASMCLMIISPNLISILLGWDGLGLVSYCLVIYYQNFKSYSAGMLTILTNRIGDVGILLGVGFMMNNGSWHFLYYLYYNYDWGFFVFIFIVLAAFTKSAQIPFSSWLPAAMAAPTPVSALVHSSTLVTAGVYLLIRFSNLLYMYDLSFLLMLSSITMFMSGLGANFEYDLKKIIALSTLSQLGFMMSILFMGYSMISFFHLLTHAFFKALLFLCAGLIIHCMNDSQDIRHMGNLILIMPYVSTCFVISNFSLCGVPFMSGFYSKDLILEVSSMNYYNLFIFVIFYLSIGLTICYTMRLCYYCLLYNNNLISYNMFFEDKNMMLSMIFLVFMAVVKGSMLSWLIFPFSYLILVPFLIKVFPLCILFIAGVLGYISSFMSFSYFLFGLGKNFIVVFFGNMWFLPSFSTWFIYSKGLNVSMEYYNFMDTGWGEYLISKLMLVYMYYLNNFNLYYQNNSIKLYFMGFIIVSAVFLLI